jgi:hypothetical protein
MTQADSVHSTPPTNTSAIDDPQSPAKPRTEAQEFAVPADAHNPRRSVSSDRAILPTGPPLDPPLTSPVALGSVDACDDEEIV